MMTDIGTTWQRIETWLTQNAPEVAAGLPPGATDAQIAEAERVLGVALPDDVRASYRRHDGQQADPAVGGGFTEGGEFLSLARIVDEWQVWKDLLDDGTFEEFESAPDPGVRADWWNPRWVPITYDGTGNNLCLDLDPAPGGMTGQIITMWHDEEARSVVAASFGEWLATLADEYERGEWASSDQYDAVVRREDIVEDEPEEAEHGA